MTDGNYEVVIRPDGGLGREHAELLLDKLSREGFRDSAITIRKVREEAEADL